MCNALAFSTIGSFRHSFFLIWFGVVLGYIQCLINVLWNGFNLCAKLTLNLVQGESTNKQHVFQNLILQGSNVILTRKELDRIELDRINENFESNHKVYPIPRI